MFKICQNFQNILNVAYYRVIVNCEVVGLSFTSSSVTSFSKFLYKEKIIIRCKFIKDVTSFINNILCLTNIRMPKRKRSTFQLDSKDSSKHHGKKQKTREELKLSHHKRKKNKSNGRKKDKKKRHSRRSKDKITYKKMHSKICRSKSSRSVNSCPQIIDIATTSENSSFSDIVIIYDSRTEHLKHTSSNSVPVIDNENEYKPSVYDTLKCKPCSILSIFEVSKASSVEVIEKDLQPSNSRHSVPVKKNKKKLALDCKESHITTQQSTEYISSCIASPDWILNEKKSSLKVGSTSPAQHHLHSRNQCDSTSLPDTSKKQPYESPSSRIESNYKFSGQGERRWQSTIMRNEGELRINEEQLIFKVLCYNVLSQSIMEDHPYLYNDHDPHSLKWEYRSQLLFNELQQLQAEILCLQEVQKNHLESFYNKLHDIGYSSIYKQRTGNKVDGVAIYYKKDIFDLTDHTSVEYFQPGVNILNRDNVGLVAKFAPKIKPSERIVVATTHLLFNPRRHDVKLAQIQLLLAEVDRFAFKGFDLRTGTPIYWPVIITGDMNFEPHTGVYELLTQGSFYYEGRSKKTLDWGAGGTTLGKVLLPQDLEITDSCQHWEVLRHRPEWALDHATEAHMLRVYNSDRKKEHSKVPQQSEMFSRPDFWMAQNYCTGFGTGRLSHSLNLHSVYTQDQPQTMKTQVTTFQDRWVVVDYIFYSNKWEPNFEKTAERNLKLISRYKLFSKAEADVIGPIPNYLYPSDHYPLCAMFALLL